MSCCTGNDTLQLAMNETKDGNGYDNVQYLKNGRFSIFYSAEIYPEFDYIFVFQ